MVWNHDVVPHAGADDGAGGDVNSAMVDRRRVLAKAQTVSGVFLFFAGLMTVLGFSGWVFGVDSLKTFGFGGEPIKPWVAVGFAFAVPAAFCSILDRRRLAGWLTTVPILIAIWTILRHLGLINGQLYRPLFPNQLAQSAILNPALPSIAAAVSFALLSAAIIAMPRQPRRFDDPSILFAGSALLLGILACLLILASDSLSDNGLAMRASLPGALINISVAIALIVPRHAQGWANLMSAGGEEWKSFRTAIPAILILPIVPSLVEYWIDRNNYLPRSNGEIIVVAGNVLIVGGLMAWAISRVLVQRGQLFYLARALDSASVVLTTTDGTIVHWSGGCRRLYGYSRDEAIGARKYELLRSRCAWPGALGFSPGLQNELEIVEVRRDGAEISLIERRQRVEIPGHEPLIVLTLTDITERVGFEAALRTSQERLALATAAHEVGVFEWNVATGVLEWSPGSEQRLGFETGSLSSYETLRARIEPADAERVRESVAQAVANRAETFGFRYRLLPIDGVARSIEGSARCIYDGKGNLIRTVGVCLETTERDTREAALMAREAQLRTILETVPHAMVIIDDKGIVQGFSATAERTWGYRSDEVLGKHFAMLATEEEGQRYIGALRRYVETGQTTALDRTVPGTGLTKDGTVFPAEIRVGVARSGGELRITMFFTDISERLVVEERVSDLNADLAHLSRQGAMSELAADLAHELNQPLTAVSNLLAAARMMTERGDDPARALELLRMGGEQTLRAGEIIRRMREFVAKRDVEMHSEQLDKLIRDAVDLVMVGTRQFDIDLDFHFDPAAQKIFADRVQVQQVIVNILRNAIEALRGLPRAQQHVWIRTRRLENALIEIEVSDSGSGIPQEMLDNICARFSTSKRETGMGIGLSISRRIVEAHGGTLIAENQPGGGATFRFTLPAAEGLDEE